MSYRDFMYSSFLLIIVILMGCTSENKTSWQIIPVDGIDNYLITAVDFPDEETGLLATSLRGNSNIYLTIDGGSTWQKIFDAEQGLHDVKFINKSKIIAVGNGGLRISWNSGQKWDAVDVSNNNPLMAVEFGSETNGLAVGMNGTIVKTANGGETWNKQESGSSSFLRDVAFIDGNTAYAVGSAGTVLKTDNGGQSWESLTTNYGGNLSAVSFLDMETGFAVGGNGTILQTTDGGSNWTKREIGTDKGLLGINFYENSGIIVGFGGTIISSADAGETWEITNSGSFPHLYDVSMINNRISVLVGDKGTVLKKN